METVQSLSLMEQSPNSTGCSSRQPLDDGHDSEVSEVELF